MRAVLIIIGWVVAINLGITCFDGSIRYLIEGDGLIWGYFCMAMIGTAIPLVLALLVGLLGRRLGLRRTWWIILSGIACGVIVIVGCIAFQKLDGSGIALTGLFLLAGGSVGFTVRPRASQQLSHE
jgi:hypothetical protein